MESQAEEQSAETLKERKMRERNEQYSRQLEEELERLKVALQTRDSADSMSRSDQASAPVLRMFMSHLPSTQQKQAGPSAAPASVDQAQEVGRLRGDLEKKTLLYEEELARREAQHSTELKALRKELRDAESQHLALQKEVLVLKDKLEKTRRERYFHPLFHRFLIRRMHPALWHLNISVLRCPFQSSLREVISVYT